ncbi:hypothetical protein ACQ4LE_001948 [Meloidogyne hapla]|uniref:Zf-LYAR domain-containing protein n=1 Tax=Meloidogyne hapla TaxID=6305 RepID=A0A1I8BZY3_MELHA
MVFFICDNCGESLKKNQVKKHTYKCKNGSFSCMDCQQVFNNKNYDQHIKCISENEKYGGANYIAKINKGEVKQDSWINQVRGAIKFVNEPQLKGLLKSIQGYTNIPRKESKFINFLQNSLKIRDHSLCEKAWEAIKIEAEKLKNKEEEQSEENENEVNNKEIEKQNEIVEEKRKRISDFPLKSILKKKKEDKNENEKSEENLMNCEPKLYPTRIVFNDSDDD